MGFTESLTLLFVAFKLAGMIDWSWWVVFMPEICAILLYIVAFVAVMMAHTPIKKKRRD